MLNIYISRPVMMGLAIMGFAVTSLAITTQADARQSRRDNTMIGSWASKSDTHVRYPGDAHVPGGGNVRKFGPDKGVYIEKCRWTANNTLLGLPIGITQRCQRYTLENTE